MTYIFHIKNDWNIFCQEGQEEIEVLVHAAANVHKLKPADGKPRTFVSLKVSKYSE